MLALPFATADAQVPPDWIAPVRPFKIADNLYYVGSKGLASYLVTTPKGHILINSNLEQSVPLLRSTVEQAGFKFEDIRVLLISHAHADHAAGSAEVKRLTGAKYMVMDDDVEVIESGGKADFQEPTSPRFLYEAVKVDRILHDGDTVALGEVLLVAHKTPGHTKGTTTWTMKVVHGDRKYNAVIIGSANVNPGYNLIDNPQYLDMAADFAETFRVLKSLRCDIFLGAHGTYFGLDTKLTAFNDGDADAFVDPEGCRRYIANREAAFQATLAKQRAARRAATR